MDLPASRHDEVTQLLADTFTAQPLIDYLFRVAGDRAERTLPDRKRQVTTCTSGSHWGCLLLLDSQGGKKAKAQKRTAFSGTVAERNWPIRVVRP